MLTLPTPCADQALMTSIREQGFAAYPRREENYELFRRCARGEVVEHLPIRLDVENVNRCNFRCSMCQVSTWPGGHAARDMTFEQFRSLIDAQYGLMEVKLQGMGEPLLNAPDFFRMIAYARSRHLWVRTTVNGSLLGVNENYRQLIDSDVCEVQISIDGASAVTFEGIRRGGRFDQVCDNVRLLNAYAASAGRERTRMWVLVQRENFPELEALVELGARLGFKRLTFSLAVGNWGQQEWVLKSRDMDMRHDLEYERALALIEQGRAAGLEVSFWIFDEKFSTQKTETLCPWPFERGYVSAGMRFVPCCVIANPAIVDLGDASDLTSTWNGEAMRAFRKAHLEGRPPEVCRGCYRD